LGGRPLSIGVGTPPVDTHGGYPLRASKTMFFNAKSNKKLIISGMISFSRIHFFLVKRTHEGLQEINFSLNLPLKV